MSKHPDKQPEDSIQAMGGKARAEKLSPERIKEIAKQAANARWNKDIPKASYEGVLKIGEGGRELPCAVILDGEIRLLSERAVTKALGGKRGGSHWKRIKEKGSGAELPVYLSASNLQPFISNELSMALKPIIYMPKIGGAAHGLRAETLPKVCNVFLKARDAGALHASQEMIAVEADMLMRGLAEIGILALVDEATGYQRDRAKDALARILEQFIAKELRAWTSTFPLKFYEEIFRLRGWRFDPTNLKRPSVVGHWTNDFVYSRLAPGVLDELRLKNPSQDGRRKHKHFQWLTDEVGDPRLRAHLDGVWRLMRGSQSWDEFRVFLNRFYPRLSRTDLGFDVEEYTKEELELIKPATGAVIPA